MKSSHNKYLPLLIGVAVAVGMLFGMRLQESLIYDGVIERSQNRPEESIGEAIDHIKSKYYGEVDYQDLTDKILSTTIEELDPYSHYFSSENDDDYSRYVQGLYEGVGMEYTLFQDSFFITAVVPESPVDRAGVKKGDIILEIDDHVISNQNLTLDSVRSLCLKNQGDSIQLNILHHKTGEEKVYNLIASNISLPLTKSFLISDHEEVVYIQVKRFYNGVFRDFMGQIDRYISDSIPVSDIVLDLRGNMGGVVDETVKIVNQFVEEKNIKLLATSNKVEREKVYKSNGRQYYNLNRLCILIDDRSASASEILAASIQDLDKGVIIGEPSYGKGVIQQNYQLSNKGSINLTIGEYILPSGRRIGKEVNKDTSYYTRLGRLIKEGHGVQPDLNVLDCSKKNNPYLNKMRTDILTQKLWEKDELLAFAIDAQANPNSKDSCDIFNMKSDYWSTISTNLKSGDKIDSRICDQTILTALEILKNDDYSKILSN